MLKALLTHHLFTTAATYVELAGASGIRSTSNRYFGSAIWFGTDIDLTLFEIRCLFLLWFSVQAKLSAPVINAFSKHSVQSVPRPGKLT